MLKAPSISESLSKSFLQSFSLFLIHSKSVQLSLAIAKALCVDKLTVKSSVSFATLLIDASQFLITQINYHLQKFREYKMINRENTSVIPKDVRQLHKTTKQKRQRMYLEGGVFSLSQHILILDLLTGTLRPGQINRLIIFHHGNSGTKFSDKYLQFPWIATILNLQSKQHSKQIPIVLVSNHPSIFQKQALENTVRMMFLKKIVIWPFGRSEIQKSLKDSKQIKLRKITHKLKLQQSETYLMNLYQRLIQICRNPSKKDNEQKITQLNRYDIHNIQFLEQCLLLYSKIDHLFYLEHIICQGSQINGSIWNSNNINIMQMIQQIYKIASNLVFFIQPKIQQSNRLINLYQLIEKPKQTKQDKKQVLQKKSQYSQQQPKNMQQPEKIPSKQLLYQLQYDLKVYCLDDKNREQSTYFSPKFIEIINTINNSFLSQNTEQKILNIDSIGDFANNYQQDQLCKNKDQQNKSCLQSCERSRKSTEQNKRINEKFQIQNNKQEKGIVRLDQLLDKSQHFYTVYIHTASKDSVRNLKKQIFNYQNSTYYRASIKSLINYLSLKRQERLNIIKKLIRRLQSKQNKQEADKSKNIKKITQKNAHSIKQKSIQKKQQEAILLQLLFKQLMTVDQILLHYEIVNDGHSQTDQLFYKQINFLSQNHRLNYLDPAQLKICRKQFRETDDSQISLTKNLKIRFSVGSGENLSKFSRNIRLICPDLCIFYHPSPAMARHLAIMQAQQNIISIRQTHVIFFQNTYQTDLIQKSVIQEDEAFWNIGQQRQKMGEFMEDPYSRIKQLFIDDQISKKQKMLDLAMKMDSQKGILLQGPPKLTRKILVDKRQFKSLLPSYLYHHGFQVVPMFLQTADYILSNNLAIQKKSVHTRDLHESLKSGRLSDQLRRMCIRFSHPYLLIQCPDLSYFKANQLNTCLNNTTGQKYYFQIRRQLIKVMSRYPRVKIVWSTSYLNSIQIISQLKKNQLEPQINKFKPSSEQNDIDDDDQSEQIDNQMSIQFSKNNLKKLRKSQQNREYKKDKLSFSRKSQINQQQE